MEKNREELNSSFFIIMKNRQKGIHYHNIFKNPKISSNLYLMPLARVLSYSKLTI
jgi:hypothetical protein